ncbi:hypothetical protein CU098_005376, partial [Rhizopus stolonifer]
SIQSTVSGFVTHHIFPKIKWNTMITNKRLRGLGILDPSLQQNALFYQWIDPLLFERPNCSMVQQFLLVHSANQFQSDNVLMCLLFPRTQSGTGGKMVSTITLVCRTVDSIPKRQFNYTLCPLDVMLLPLNATPMTTIWLVTTSLKNEHPVFIQCTKPTSLNLYSPKHVPAIQRSVGFNAFRRRLILPQDDLILNNLATSCRAFRAQVSRQTIVSIQQHQVYFKAAWSRFWSMALTTVQRSVAYRLLHCLIPTRKFLARIIPDRHPSPSCCLCGEFEDIYYFFFRCLSKFIFWDHIIREFLWPEFTIDQIFSVLTCLDFSFIQVLPSCSLPPSKLLTVALFEVWKVHWSHIHNDQPFSPLTTFRSV